MKRNSAGVFTVHCANALHTQWTASANISHTEQQDGCSSCKLVRPTPSERKQFTDDFNVVIRPASNTKSGQKEPRICGHCLAFLAAKRCQTPVAAAVPSTSSAPHYSLSFVEDCLTSEFLDFLTDEQACQLALLLGKRQSKKKKNRDSVDKIYKTVESLAELDLLDYMNSFDSVLIQFLNGLIGTPSKECDIYKRGKVLEQIFYEQVNGNIVLPLCFTQNLLLYAQTTSQKAVDILGRTGPYGCHDTVSDWLKKQTRDPSKYPDEDIVIVFDNNQVIGRCWTIKTNNKVKASVVTTVCGIVFTGHGRLQWRGDLVPERWEEPSQDDVVQMIREVPAAITNHHLALLYHAIEGHIPVLVAEQHANPDGGWKDGIDDAVLKLEREAVEKQCLKCATWNPKSKRLCQNCRSSFKQAEMEEHGIDKLGTFEVAAPRKDTSTSTKEVRVEVVTSPGAKPKVQAVQSSDSNTSFSYLPSGHRQEAPKLHIVDPVFVNPNSHDSLRLILRQIGIGVGIKLYGTGTRLWTFVVCDGLPYGLAQTVMKNTLRCPMCFNTGDWFEGIEKFVQHKNTVHPDTVCEPIKEFSWVVLRPGMGHLEMNMVKSIVELNWEVLFQDLAKLMGFRSEAGLRAAKRCSDHHKGWSLLDITYNATLKELLVPFIRISLEKNETPSARSFVSFGLKQARDPNYVYMCTMVFTYFQAVQNFRAGLRRLHIPTLESAKKIFAPLFHSRNHPKYQRLEVEDALQRLKVPKELQSFYDETESVIISDDKYSGEGLDFKCEVINKQVQAWMPRGIPSGADWLRVCRSLEQLEKIKHKTMVNTGCMPSKRRRRSNYAEVARFRAELRMKKYLSSPLLQRPHVSLSGEPLDKALTDFQTQAEQRRVEFFDFFYGGIELGEMKTPLVCVTAKDRESAMDINTMSKAKLVFHIEKELDSVIECEDKEVLQTEFQTVKGRVSRVKKDVLISLVIRIVEIKQATVDEVIDEDDGVNSDE